MSYLLAEVNVGWMKAPMGDPFMADIAVRLDDLHRLAERSPGFVWRKRGEDVTPEELALLGDVFAPFDPLRLFLTISVWRDVDALRDFVYATVHVDLLRQRRRWMYELGRPSAALWWIPASHRPSVAEAGDRLRTLAAAGPGARVFTFAARRPAPVLDVRAVSSMRPEAMSLIADLDAEIAHRYPGAPVRNLTPADLADPHVTFLMADIDGRPAGCGALRWRERGVAEIKRMFVRPDYRGLGVARGVLSALEAHASAGGARRIVLETGAAQPEAIALYQSSGYAAIPAFGEYLDIAVSRCFEKAVVPL